MTMLLDATSLAKELGVSTWVTKASKRAGAHYGDTPWTGRYTTKDRFLAWLERHPDFVANRWLRVPAVSPSAASQSGGAGRNRTAENRGRSRSGCKR